MRHLLWLASASLIALSVMPTASPRFGIAQASDSSGRVWNDALNKWRTDIAQLTLRIRDYQLRPHYCRPPHRDDKTFDEVSLRQLEEELGVLSGEFERIRKGTIAATQSSTGGSLTTDRLMTGNYPTYKGYDVRDPQHWTLLRRDQIGETEKLMRDKKAALASAPEHYCSDPETRKLKEVIGGSPPVPPADPQVPAPQFLPVNVPGRPARFCSLDEKDAFLAALAQQRVDMIENEKRAYRWAQALSAAASRKPRNASALLQLHEAAIAQREAYLAMYRQAERLYVDVRDNMHVEKCGGTNKKEIGSIPGGGIGVTGEVGGGVGTIKIPRKPYLALEDAGSLRLGVVDTKRSETIAALLLGLAYDLDFVPQLNFAGAFGSGDPLTQRMFAEASFEAQEATLRASGGTLTTTTEGLGIPGTGDPSHPSPAGYFLANPGLNDVENITQLHVSTLDKLDLAISQEQRFQCWSNTLSIGTRIGRLESLDRVSGSIPGYARDFEYETDLETAVWGLFVATDAELSLDRAWQDRYDAGLRYAGEFSGFSLSGGVRLGVDSVAVEGTDRLSFTGFAPQSIRVAKDDVTFSYRLSAGLNYSPPEARALKFSLGVSYGQDDIHPVPHRSGETGDRTRIEIDPQDEFFGTVRTKIAF